MIAPAAEIDIDEDLLRALLEAQHPDLADRPLRPFAQGWDNALWRVGDDLIARLPRREMAAGLVHHEQRWLPTLAPGLPLPIPVPVRVGRPSATYPWPWSVVPWFDGEPGDRAGAIDEPVVAAQLGGFLRALHRPAPPDAPHNPYRGVPLAERADAFAERLALVAAEVDAEAIRSAWDRAVSAAPFSGPPVWLHGDPHPANLLFTGGRLAAVVDFGDLCAGDPASDLAAAWMLLSPSAMARFVEAYGGLDADVEARARGWATWFGVFLLAIGLADTPTYEPVGRRTLAHALARTTPT